MFCTAAEPQTGQPRLTFPLQMWIIDHLVIYNGRQHTKQIGLPDHCGFSTAVWSQYGCTAKCTVLSGVEPESA